MDSLQVDEFQKFEHFASMAIDLDMVMGTDRNMSGGDVWLLGEEVIYIFGLFAVWIRGNLQKAIS